MVSRARVRRRTCPEPVEWARVEPHPANPPLAWGRGRTRPELAEGFRRLRRKSVRARPSTHHGPTWRLPIFTLSEGRGRLRRPRRNSVRGPPGQPTPAHPTLLSRCPALHPLQGERQIRASSAEIGEGSPGQPTPAHPTLLSRCPALHPLRGERQTPPSPAEFGEGSSGRGLSPNQAAWRHQNDSLPLSPLLFVSMQCTLETPFPKSLPRTLHARPPNPPTHLPDAWPPLVPHLS